MLERVLRNVFEFFRGGRSIRALLDFVVLVFVYDRHGQPVLAPIPSYPVSKFGWLLF